MTDSDIGRSSICMRTGLCVDGSTKDAWWIDEAEVEVDASGVYGENIG